MFMDYKDVFDNQAQEGNLISDNTKGKLEKINKYRRINKQIYKYILTATKHFSMIRETITCNRTDFIWQNEQAFVCKGYFDIF